MTKVHFAGMWGSLKGEDKAPDQEQNSVSAFPAVQNPFHLSAFGLLDTLWRNCRQEVDTIEQPELLPRKEGVGILPGAFPWAALFPTDSKIGLCLEHD